MAIAADRPGAASSPRAVTLRIKRGAKLLSDVKIGRSRVVIGGGKTAQLRLKNAGLADECIVIDTRTEPFGIENKLGPDDVRVNGRAMMSSNIRLGDVIEMSGLTLELLDGAVAQPAAEPQAPTQTERDEIAPAKPAARPPVPPATRPPIRPAAPPAPAAPRGGPLADAREGTAEPSAKALPEEAVDPYLGKFTAAKVSKEELERAAGARRASAQEQPAMRPSERPTVEPAKPPARPVIPPKPPPQMAPAEAVAATRPSVRPPWIELVGDDQVAEARLYLQDGTTAGRQGDVRVRHPSVSKKHAQFSVVGDRLFVEDLGSTNGVWINRERITTRSPLKEGDVLHLGAVEFTVRIPGEAKQPEVTNFAANPEPSIPTAARLGAIDPPIGDRATEQDAEVRRTMRESPSVLPRTRDSRELRTENEGVPSSSVWEELEADDPRGARDRGTERELPAGKKRPTEREQRSPSEGRRAPPEGGSAAPLADADEPLELESPRGARDYRTEREIPAAKKRPTEREQPSPVQGKRPTEREQASPLQTKKRPTEREQPSPMFDDEIADAPASPFSEDEVAPTGTGRPGRRDRTEREIKKAEVAARLNVPAPPAAKNPTPSELFGDVEDLSEKYAKSGRADTRAPARTTVRPPEPFTGEALREDDFVPPRRRSAGKMIGVAVLGFLFGGVIVGGLAVWPWVAERMGGPSIEIADSGIEIPADGQPGAMATSKPVKVKDGKGGKSGKGTRVADSGRTVPRATPEVGAISGDIGLDGGIPEDDGPKSIFDDKPIDLSGDGRLDKELASLEKGSAEAGLRAERTIGTDELKSIFLGDSSAVVRKYADDGFTQAPSAADEDPREAEARRQGAKQIDPNKVNAMIRENFPKVKRCLVGASVKRGKARVVVEFTIQPSGKTENVSVIDSDIPGSSFKGCVAGVVRGIKFPKTKDQSVVVQFPFVFTYN